MLRPILLAAALLASPCAVAQQTDWAKQIAEWNVPTAPFHIAGRVYYVGTAGLSAYLITDPAGHVLIDGGVPQSAKQIAANIRRLGFRVENVRYLLINHAHFDHAGGLAELKQLTGAQLLASAGDKPDIESGKTVGRPDLPPFPPVTVDRVVADGDHIRLGGTDLTVHLTPGHTRGCTSWTMRSGGLDLIFACSITVAGQPLTPGKGYDAAASDFRATFAKLKGLHADIFLNFHPSAFDMEAKRKKLAAGDARAFVDPSELQRRVAAAEAAFEAELAGKP